MAQNLGQVSNQVTDEEGKKHIDVTITLRGLVLKFEEWLTKPYLSHQTVEMP